MFLSKKSILKPISQDFMINLRKQNENNTTNKTKIRNSFVESYENRTIKNQQQKQCKKKIFL